MKIKLIFILICSLVLVACNQPNDDYEIYNPNRKDVGKAEVNLKLQSVFMSDILDMDSNNTLSFVVSLERPDLGLKQPPNDSTDYQDHIFTADLPLGLQPRLMYVSEVGDTARDSGSMCNRPVFPHGCDVLLSADDYAKGEKTFLVKILFEDDTYASSEITVPFPDKLLSPAISEPSVIPKQESTFDMSFKDIGADEYHVAMDLCHPYQNDGINPCLDGIEYFFERKGGQLIDNSYSDYYPVVLEKDGDIVHLTSEFPLYFSESVVYTITAEKHGEVAEGISFTTESHAVKTFEI